MSFYDRKWQKLATRIISKLRKMDKIRVLTNGDNPSRQSHQNRPKNWYQIRLKILCRIRVYAVWKICRGSVANGALYSQQQELEFALENVATIRRSYPKRTPNNERLKKVGLQCGRTIIHFASLQSRKMCIYTRSRIVYFPAIIVRMYISLYTALYDQLKVRLESRLCSIWYYGVTRINDIVDFILYVCVTCCQVVVASKHIMFAACGHLI